MEKAIKHSINKYKILQIEPILEACTVIVAFFISIYMSVSSSA